MSAPTFVIMGLLAATQYAAGCSVVTPPDSCKNDYIPVCSTSPIGPDFVCIKLYKEGGPMTYETAKQSCLADGGFLAEPIGYLHQAIYELILSRGYEQEAFWIGGSDFLHEDYWKWETSGLEMPRSTPHWYPCEPSQPLESDTNANHACMLAPDFYFWSCTEGIEILAMCQMYP